MDVEEKLTQLNQRYKKHTGRELPTGILGDVNGNIRDPLRPGYAIVRISTSNGLSQPRSILLPNNVSIDLTAGKAVKLGYDDKGNAIIVGMDTHAQLAQGEDTLATMQLAQRTRTPQQSLETLAVIPTSPPSMAVIVKSWNPIVNGTAYQYPGTGPTGQSLTSVQPSAGNMCYAVISVKNDYATLEVTSSTPRGVTDVPLGLADIQEAITAATSTSTPIYAILLTGDMTVVTLDDIENDGVDLRQLVNVASAALSVTDGSTTVSPATSIDFTSGATVTDGGGGVAQVAVSGGSGDPTLAMAYTWFLG